MNDDDSPPGNDDPTVAHSTPEPTEAILADGDSTNAMGTGGRRSAKWWAIGGGVAAVIVILVVAFLVLRDDNGDSDTTTAEAATTSDDTDADISDGAEPSGDAPSGDGDPDGGGDTSGAVIESFTGPSTVRCEPAPSEVELSWSVTGADEVTIHTPSGSMTRPPTGSDAFPFSEPQSTYRLEAAGSDGTAVEMVLDVSCLMRFGEPEVIAP